MPTCTVHVSMQCRLAAQALTTRLGVLLPFEGKYLNNNRAQWHLGTQIHQPPTAMLRVLTQPQFERTTALHVLPLPALRSPHYRLPSLPARLRTGRRPLGGPQPAAASRRDSKRPTSLSSHG